MDDDWCMRAPPRNSEIQQPSHIGVLRLVRSDACTTLPSGNRRESELPAARATKAADEQWVEVVSDGSDMGSDYRTTGLWLRTGCAARLANLAKRLECGQLAAAFGPPTAPKSGSKLHAPR